MRPPRLPEPADAYHVELTYFTPAGAEQVTGLSTAMQRDWRKRGYLDQRDGHARFTILDLCRLFLLKSLSDRGVGPDKASSVVSDAAYDLAFQVLRCHETWTVIGFCPPWNIISNGFAARALNAQNQGMTIRGSGIQHPKFIWWADDTNSLCDSLEQVLNSTISDDPRFCGPIIVLDLFVFSGMIIDKMPAPFATARDASEENNKSEIPTSRDSRISQRGGQKPPPERKAK